MYASSVIHSIGIYMSLPQLHPMGHRSVFNTWQHCSLKWPALDQHVQHVYADMHIDHVSTTLEMVCYKFLWQIIIEQQKYIWLYIWNGKIIIEIKNVSGFIFGMAKKSTSVTNK